MRRDAEIAHAGGGRQHEVDRGRLPAGAPALIEHMGDGGGADGAAGERFREGGVEGRRADLIEQAQQTRGLAGEQVAANGEGGEERLRLRAGLPEAIAAAQVVGTTLLGDQRREMRVVFDALLAIIAARVARDLGRALEEAHEVFGGDEGEGSTHEPVRDRVVVAIEADVGRLAGADGAEEVAAEGMLGERQQARLLLRQRLGHALLSAVRHGPRMRDVGDPARPWRVEVLDRAERARGEERVPKESQESFDPAFFIAAGHRTRLRGEVIVASELEQARMKPDVITDPFQNDALQIVVADRAGYPLKRGERLDVAAQKALERWPRRKLSSV